MEGIQQSPIDLTSNTLPARHDLALQYIPAPLEVVNNGYTAQVNVAPGSVLMTGGVQYALQQFHFHRQSEHTVNGKPADMELHLLHLDSAGNIAVVGVFLTAGRQHEALQSVWVNLPPQKNENRLVEGVEFNAASLLPADLNYYSYVGSLTTPPYTEGVRWFVLSAPVEVSKEQVARFGSLFSMNARPIQPLNGREVHFSRAAE